MSCRAACGLIRKQPVDRYSRTSRQRLHRTDQRGGFERLHAPAKQEHGRTPPGWSARTRTGRWDAVAKCGNPARCQTFDLAFGKAHVFYPTANENVCTAALLLDLDPISLARGWRGPAGDTGLGQYVNDRPYVASSFMSVAIAQVYGSALNGTSRERPELAETPMSLEASMPVVPCRGGEGLLRSVFEPLGYTVTAGRLPLDSSFPEWGESPYYSVTLAATCRLQDLLSHLYVLLPVLDDDKHYWTGQDEIEKLLQKGEGWLADHPEREQITRRYLRRRRHLVDEALARTGTFC